MKKLLAAILLVALCASLCVACREEEGIVFYHTMGAPLRKVLDKYIAKFNEIYPDIVISHKQVGGYDDVKKQINRDLDVGKEPHLAYCYPDHVAGYNLAGATVELDVYMNSTETIPAGKFGNKEAMPVGMTEAQINDLKAGGFYEEGLQFGQNADGKTPMYTLPFSKSTEVLYYNKTFFTANNIPVPTHWWCDENCEAGCNSSMEKVCQRILELKPDCTPLGYDSEANWFITMCEQYSTVLEGNPQLYTSATGEHYLFNNETTKSFVKRFNEWRSKNYVTTQKIYGKYTSNLFKEQESYMSIGSSAGANNQVPEKVNGKYKFDVGIATIPQMNSDVTKHKVISQGPSLCMFQKANKDEEMQAWLFIKFLLTNAQFQAEFSRASGYVPVLGSVMDDPVYQEFLDNADGGDFIAALTAKVCIEQASAYYTSPAFVGSSAARDEVNALLVKCLGLKGADLDKQIDAAFEEAIKNCEKNSF